jgi:predicted short-subunit dehydrogenase-like oxidoreductase (DUF2520 family)
MKISIIGSGNVATHIAKAIAQQNIALQSIWSNNFGNAKKLAERVGAKAVANVTDLLNDGSEVLIIAIKDDAIAAVAKQIVGYTGVVAHTSGAVALNALDTFEQFGVFYPLQTFSKHTDLDFSKVPLCIEANNDESLEVLKKLAYTLGNRVYEVNSKKRQTLHLAAVFACNFPNYLYSIAQQMLAKEDLDFEIIRPLIKETANKVQDDLPSNVQTGPAVRNDLTTLDKHERLLKDSSEWLTIYKLLSQQIKNTK